MSTLQLSVSAIPDLLHSIVLYHGLAYNKQTCQLNFEGANVVSEEAPETGRKHRAGAGLSPHQLLLSALRLITPSYPPSLLHLTFPFIT